MKALPIGASEDTMYKAMPQIKETADELKRLQKHERDALKHKRLRALYLIASGQATQRQQVAARLGVSRNSVARWLNAYALGGLSAMLTIKPSPGKAPALNPDQLAQLKEALARPAGFGSYRDVQRWIAEEVGVEMTYDAVYGLVHDKLKAHLKVPRLSHPQKTSKR